MAIEFGVYNSLTNTTTNVVGAAITTSTLLQFQPQPATWDDATGTWQVVDETVLVQTRTAATGRTLVTSLNRLFQQAALAERNRAVHSGVYVQYRPDGSETLYRTPVMRGRAYLEQHRLPIQVRIEFTRAHYWETDAEGDLVWSTGFSDKALINATSGVGNTIDISETNVGGDLPTPIRIKVLNTTNSSDGTKDILVGCAHGMQTAWNGILEGEDWTTSYAGAATVASGASSGGFYRSIPVPSIDALWFTSIPDDYLYIIREGWLLSSTAVNALNGRLVKPVVRVVGLPASGIQIAFAVGYGTTGGYGDEVKYRTDWQDALTDGQYGLIEGQAMRIPTNNTPLSSGQTVGATWSFFLLLRKTTTGDSTINIDYVQLFPADEFLRFDTSTGVTEYNETAIQDIDHSRAHVLNGTVKRIAYQVRGGPVEVLHDQKTRLYFLHEDESATASISRTFTVSAKYRSRRLTI